MSTSKRQWERKLKVKCAFCGGKYCLRCSEICALKQKNGAVRGLHSNWINDQLLAMMRPSDRLLKKYAIPSWFKEHDVKAVINLTVPGEHPFCGDGLAESGFPYTPELLMSEGVMFYNFGWEDMTVPRMSLMLDIVRVCASVLKNESKIAVHCHAGYGRTGIVICCLLIHFWKMGAVQAVALVRSKRPGSVQTPQQNQFIYDFEKCTENSRVIYTDMKCFASKVSLPEFLENQGFMIHQPEKDRVLRWVPRPVQIAVDTLVNLAQNNVRQVAAAMVDVREPLLLSLQQSLPVTVSSFSSLPSTDNTNLGQNEGGGKTESQLLDASPWTRSESALEKKMPAPLVCNTNLHLKSCSDLHSAPCSPLRQDISDPPITVLSPLVKNSRFSSSHTDLLRERTTSDFMISKRFVSDSEDHSAQEGLKKQAQFRALAETFTPGVQSRESTRGKRQYPYKEVQSQLSPQRLAAWEENHEALLVQLKAAANREDWGLWGHMITESHKPPNECSLDSRVPAQLLYDWLGQLKSPVLPISILEEFSVLLEADPASAERLPTVSSLSGRKAISQLKSLHALDRCAKRTTEAILSIFREIQGAPAQLYKRPCLRLGISLFHLEDKYACLLKKRHLNYSETVSTPRATRRPSRRSSISEFQNEYSAFQHFEPPGTAGPENGCEWESEKAFPQSSRAQMNAKELKDVVALIALMVADWHPQDSLVPSPYAQSRKPPTSKRELEIKTTVQLLCSQLDQTAVQTIHPIQKGDRSRRASRSLSQLEYAAYLIPPEALPTHPETARTHQSNNQDEEKSFVEKPLQQIEAPTPAMVETPENSFPAETFFRDPKFPLAQLRDPVRRSATGSPFNSKKLLGKTLDNFGATLHTARSHASPRALRQFAGTFPTGTIAEQDRLLAVSKHPSLSLSKTVLPDIRQNQDNITKHSDSRHFKAFFAGRSIQR